MRRAIHKLTEWLDNLSIRAKLLAYAGALIAFIALLGGFAQIVVADIQGRQLPARAAVRDINLALQSMRTSEQWFINDVNSLNTEFYLKHESPALNAWRESYQRFETRYAQLAAFYGRTQLGTDHLQPIPPLMQAYRDAFLNLSSTYQQRGFQSFGRVGVLRQRAASLLASLEGRTQQQSLVLRMVQAQNEFLLHKDMQQAGAFADLGKQLESQLAATAERTDLEEYMRLFQEVVQLDQKIGLTAGEGLRGTLGTQISDVARHVNAVEERVLLTTDRSIGAISRSIGVLSVVVFGVAIVLAVVISRFIVRRLQRLLKASQRITSGDLDYRLTVQGRDELGKLTESFNSMAQKLQDDQRALRQRAIELTESVNRFELVSRAVNEAIYEWDLQSDVLNWGDGLVTVFGYRAADRKGMIDWWTERIHADDAERVNNALADRMRRHSSTWKMRYRFKRANGKYAFCQDRGFIEYKNGKAVRMVGSLVDVTREMELERAKDEFISIASHQLRTPLGSIRWNLELLLEKISTLPKEAQDYIQEAYGSTKRMLGLVGDLLSVARIEQGRVQDMPEQVDIVHVIEQALGEMRPIARQRKIEFSTEHLRGSIEVMIDPKRFREVVQNLLSNAVKYTPVGGHVEVAAVLKKDPDSIVVSIADNGIGIPSEEQANMFSKFFRAKNVIATDTEGSGLGLFVVKSYVEAWGGRIWFTSVINKGTTFYISIPRKPHLQKRVIER